MSLQSQKESKQSPQPLPAFVSWLLSPFSGIVTGRGFSPVTEHLQKLIDAAQNRPFTEAEREAQRRSFAYGNTHIENANVTREMIDEQAEILDRELASTAER
jgi:hypothetical protein